MYTIEEMIMPDALTREPRLHYIIKANGKMVAIRMTRATAEKFLKYNR